MCLKTAIEGEAFLGRKGICQMTKARRIRKRRKLKSWRLKAGFDYATLIALNDALNDGPCPGRLAFSRPLDFNH